jgi:hypothetical protein
VQPAPTLLSVCTDDNDNDGDGDGGGVGCVLLL